MAQYLELHITKKTFERLIFILLIIIMLGLSFFAYKRASGTCPEVKCEEPIVEEETKPVEKEEPVEPTQEEQSIYYVDIEKLRFAPKELIAKQGSTLIFRNKEVTTAHKLYEVKGLFYGPRMLPGDSFNYTFEKTGNYTIFSITGKEQGTKMTVEVIEK